MNTCSIRARRGATLVYATLLVVALCGIISLGVDYGRVELARTELQAAADAAARYGAGGLTHGPAAARANAIAASAENSADGASVALSNGDVQVGQWVSANRSFVALPDESAAINAVRVTARRRAADGNAVPLTFAKLIGKSTADVGAISVALFNPGVDVDLGVPASSNPWLAGMPDGTLANTYLYNRSVRKDRAGAYTDPQGVYHPQGESPSLMTGMTLIAGESLSFDAIAGTGQHGATQTISGPDGNLAKITQARAGAEFGKSNVVAPIDAVVAVFLDDSNPNGQTPPATLDFTTQSARDFSTLAPQVRQVFFIGDGRATDGTVQQIVVPSGATRLYIGKMDGTEWNNNLGVSTVSIHRAGTVSMVE